MSARRPYGMSLRERIRATFALHGGRLSIWQLREHLAADGVRASETCRRALTESEDGDGMPFAVPVRRRRRRL